MVAWAAGRETVSRYVLAEWPILSQSTPSAEVRVGRSRSVHRADLGGPLRVQPALKHLDLISDSDQGRDEAVH
jgi:hypothetical protein